LALCNTSSSGPEEVLGLEPTYLRSLLPEAVQPKFVKQHAKPASAKFVLLTYSVVSLLLKNDPDIAESQRHLETYVGRGRRLGPDT
jgi:hypothetical protein